MGVDVYKCLRIKYTGRCIATPRTDGGVKMEMHGSGRYRRNPAVSTLSAEIYGSAGVGRGGVNILAECAIYRSYAEGKSAIYFLRMFVCPPPTRTKFQSCASSTVRKPTVPFHRL